MKERSKKIVGLTGKDEATMNFVSRQAQEAILDPNLPEFYKDYVLDVAVEALQRIGEKRHAYNASSIESRELKQPHTIYEAENERKNSPPVIAELNDRLEKDAPEEMEGSTVEGIAAKVRINKNVLHELAKTDSKFFGPLEKLKNVQEKETLKTETDEDTFVDVMMITFLLLEAKDQHSKSEDQ